MKSTAAILNKIVTRTWYDEQAGLFFFIFLVFFGAVAPSMQLAYHYSLIRGMLEAPVFMGLVALAWLGYAIKLDRFVDRLLRSPEYLFLYKLCDLPPGQLREGVRERHRYPHIGWLLPGGGESAVDVVGGGAGGGEYSWPPSPAATCPAPNTELFSTRTFGASVPVTGRNF